MSLEKQIIQNAFLVVEIDEYLKKIKTDRIKLEECCKKRNLCLGIITKLKVSPYYFNKDANNLTYIFLDIDLKTAKPILKNNKKIYENIEENKIKWG